MLKFLAVWIIVIFMKSCCRKASKKKAFANNRSYRRTAQKRIERRVERAKTTPIVNIGYDSARNVSKQVILYSKCGKTVRVNASLAGRRYNYV